ncbi:putative transporter subunit: permease component of ABC superfamily transporter [Mesorhizobium sp. SOD10]|nr:putative transporter subunit: permease component of ABC superfamily transporter [Mesorhizobium sp. SOD10]
MNATYQFNWSVIDAHMWPMLVGLVLMIRLTIVGMVISLAFGLILALMRMSAARPVRVLASGVIDVVRSVPLIILLFWLYYGLAAQLGIAMQAFTAGAIALGITGSAYMAEVYRGGLEAVESGQREAAAAMGLTRAVAFQTVVLPQAARLVVAPTINVFVMLLKGATIMSTIGVADMIFVARQVSLRTFTPFELYTFAGLVLIVITLILAAIGGVIERRLSKGAGRHA